MKPRARLDIAPKHTTPYSSKPDNTFTFDSDEEHSCYFQGYHTLLWQLH